MEEDSAVATPSVVMMGFRSAPFRLFFPELPLVVLFKLAALAICFGFIVAFLTSAPFMVYWPEAAGQVVIRVLMKRRTVLKEKTETEIR